MWIAIGIMSALSIMKQKLKWKNKTLIKIQGHLNGKWKECFEGIEFSYEENNTILTGTIKNEAHLQEVLNIISNYNLILISINPEKRKLLIESNLLSKWWKRTDMWSWDIKRGILLL